MSPNELLAIELLATELLAIERAAVRAWPASETHDIDGWLWRYSGGASQRANSVSTLDYRGADLESAIQRAEQRYEARQSVWRFQFGGGSTPKGLDQELLRRGYVIKETITTLARRVETRRPTKAAEVVVTSSASDDWLSVYLAGVSKDRRAAAPSILARVPEQRGFVLASRDGKPVATALCVVTDDIAIVECVMTDAAARRTGAAVAVMIELEDWAIRRGARILALQAVLTNTAAQALYASLGYAEIGRQHYFVRD
jgi:N-acetylglutamate synthase